MTSMKVYENYAEVTVYTNRPERILQNSGKNGIFAQAAKEEKALRDPYTVVKAPTQMTTAKMLKSCDESTQGLVRNAHGTFWRVQCDQVEKFRTKMGLASVVPRAKLFEVGPIPTRFLGGLLGTTLSKWGWSGVRALKSRADGAGHSTWLVSSVGQPPARTVVLDGCIFAHIKDAARTQLGRGQKSKQKEAEAKNVRPASAAGAPRTLQASHQSTGAETRTWAQVVAGRTQLQPKARAQTHMQDDPKGKTQMQMQKMTARMAELEKRLDRETSARAEQGAKIDAIFAFVQSVGTSPRPADTHAAATRARENEPTQKPKRSRRNSGEDTWVTLPPREEGLPQDEQGMRSTNEQKEKTEWKKPRKTAASKSRTKAAARKRTQRRNGRN